MENMVDQSFWKNKKVFITGHSGFKGGWMSIWLNSMGAQVKGYSLEPNTTQNFYKIVGIKNLLDSEINDVRDFSKLEDSINLFKPDIVIHMAAQPLVRSSYDDPLTTYQTNVIGTANILEISLKSESVKAVINITTDKCYENDGRKNGYLETDPMGGYDPYSSSKGCAELVTSSFYNSFYKSANKGLCSVRAGNVIGGGDWAEDRLIPDILKKFTNKETLFIRNKNATRPWQHVLEPLSGYLILAQNLFKNPEIFSGGYNFGPLDSDVKNVEWIVNKMSQFFPDSKWKIDDSKNPHEANFLKLDIKKADKMLDWSPTWNINIALNNIIDWHNAFNNNEDMLAHSCEEIAKYMSDSMQKN